MTYSDASLCGIQSTGLQVQINGTDWTDLFTATSMGAQAQLTENTALPARQNTITAKISDKAGNQATATTTFTVELTPPKPPARLSLPAGQLSAFEIPGDPETSSEIRILVADEDGKGVPNTPVLFEIVQGTGSIGSMSTIKPSWKL